MNGKARLLDGKGNLVGTSNQTKHNLFYLIVIFYDNISAIKIPKNPMIHTKTKNITIKYHFLRELVQRQRGEIEICEY